MSFAIDLGILFDKLYQTVGILRWTEKPNFDVRSELENFDTQSSQYSQLFLGALEQKMHTKVQGRLKIVVIQKSHN